MAAEQAAQTATEFAAQTGRLDFLSTALAILTALLAMTGLVGFFVVRSAVTDRAERIAKSASESAVSDYLTQHGSQLIREALDDARVVSRLQIELAKLGLDDTESADEVDDDPQWTPECDNE